METIDFLPERIKLQRARRKRLARQGYLLVVLAIGLAVWAYTSTQRVSRAQAELQLLQDGSANIQRLLTQRTALQQQQSDLLIKERIGRQLGSRANVLDVLSELERLLPPGVSLTNLNLEAIQMDLPVVPASPDGSGNPGVRRQMPVNRVRLVLTGISPTDVDIANFIGQLSASPLFEDVNMGYSKDMVFQNHRVREFQVSCHMVR